MLQSVGRFSSLLSGIRNCPERSLFARLDPAAQDSIFKHHLNKSADIRFPGSKATPAAERNSFPKIRPTEARSARFCHSPSGGQSPGMRFALIVCEDDPDMGGEENVGRVMTETFRNNRNVESKLDQWTAVHAVSKPLPCIAELCRYDGIVMTGSHYSVNDQLPWMMNLERTVRGIRRHQETDGCGYPKLFGICFSHQLIAKALGGVVQTHEEQFIVSGGDKVYLSPEITDRVYFKQSFPKDRKHFTIMKLHQDCVSQLPRGAVFAGTSRTCKHEAVLYGDSIITLQGHPEVSMQGLMSGTLPRMLRRGFLTELDAQQIKTSAEEIDFRQLVQFILNFLKSPPVPIPGSVC